MYRKLSEQKKLKKLVQQHPRYGSGAYFDDHKHRYIKLNRGKRWTYLKKVSNRKLRRSKTPNPTHKEFDVEWNYI